MAWTRSRSADIRDVPSDWRGTQRGWCLASGRGYGAPAPTRRRRSAAAAATVYHARGVVSSITPRRAFSSVE